MIKKLVIITLFIPFLVLAEECDLDKISITSLEQVSIDGNTESVDNATFDDKTMNFNLKMFEVGDSITYNITIKNDSNEDYMIEEKSFKLDNDYIEYILKSSNGTNVVKANSTSTLTITIKYKKEVEDSLLVDGKYNNQSTVKMSLNTSAKEQKIEFITTDKTKNIDNPITSTYDIKLIIVILIISMIIILLTIINKKKYSKYIILILPFIIMPTIYAICKCEIEVSSNIEIKKEDTVYDAIEKLSKEENSCISKYEGQVTDELNKTVDAKNVYFNKCSNRNIIFGNYCWQIIRTTETKGIRMIYNGDVVDGKCESTRDDHLGIVGINPSTKRIDSPYLYSSTFTYDLENKTFTLINPEEYTWSNDTYENILGKYTCLNQESTCTTLYNINGYSSNTNAYFTSYTIDNTNYAQIGISPYNLNANTLNMISYMYNKTHSVIERGMNTTNYLYGNSFVYDSETDTYTLDGETQIIGDWETGYDKLSNTHYTCWNTTGTCKKISYVFHTALKSYGYSYKRAIYVELSNGLSIDDILRDWFEGEDINKYDSTVKALLENWYYNYLIDYDDYVEDTVYCNDMSIKDYVGFKPDGDMAEVSPIRFNASAGNDLSCNNKIYQFTTNNTFAKLKYPINLMKPAEYSLLSKDNKELVTTGSMYMISPHLYLIGDKGIGVALSMMWYYPVSTMPNGVRPVITLKNNSLISSGDGSEADPWVIK